LFWKPSTAGGLVPTILGSLPVHLDAQSPPKGVGKSSSAASAAQGTCKEATLRKKQRNDLDAPTQNASGK